MPISTKQPPEAQQSPYAPSTIEPLLFELYAGMNTSALRAGVPDSQCYWIDGFFPQAPRNLRTMYGVGPSLYIATAGITIIFFTFGNLGTTPIAVVFLSDGSVVQVNTNTQVVTTILPPGTILSPSILNCGVSQWGSQYVIIVANQPNGYWVWDGTAVYKSGTLSPVVTLTSVGSGYTQAPTVVAFGGHGSGVSLVASINSTIGIVTGVSVVNAGSGYLANDNVSVSFIGGNTGGSGASIVPIYTGGGGGFFTIAALSIISGGSLYSNNPSVSFVSNVTTVPATAIANVSGGSIVSTSVTSPGIYAGTTGTTVVITDTSTSASATLQLMPYGISGHAVETYQGHVWVAKGPTIYFTAPGSFTDFATSTGGGNFTSSDSFLQIGFVQLISANGFLYLVADSSINYISGVQTSGTPPTTTFTNQNADPEVGTPYPASVETFGREILFANAYGIQVCNGAQVSKVSKMLDGVYNTVADFGGLQLCSSKAVVFGRKLWMVLVKILDPVSGVSSNKLFMTDGARDDSGNFKFWASSQDMTLTYINHQEINSVITAYGTDGATIKPLFSTPSTAFEKIVQSRLWDAPGGYQFVKTTGRLNLIGYYNALNSPNLRVGVDSELGLMASLYTLTPSGAGYFVSDPQAIGQKGVLMGLTIRTNCDDMALVSAMIMPDVHDFRG